MELNYFHVIIVLNIKYCSLNICYFLNVFDKNPFQPFFISVINSLVYNLLLLQITFVSLYKE